MSEANPTPGPAPAQNRCQLCGNLSGLDVFCSEKCCEYAKAQSLQFIAEELRELRIAIGLIPIKAGK